MEEELRKANPNLKSYKDLEVLGAFITFNDAENRAKCIKDYRKYNKTL
jgi:hypothetical protein